MLLTIIHRCKLLIFFSLLTVLVPRYLYALNCPDDAVSYWKLDETTSTTYADSINGNDGSCSGSCPDARSTGAVDGSQEFDGISSGISIPASTDFNWSSNASFSIEMWVKRTSATINANGEVLVGRIDTATSLEWWIEIRDVSGSGLAAFRLADINGDGAGTEVVGSKPISLDRWHHIVIIRDASSQTNMLYVDGDLDAQQQNLQYSGGFASSSAALNIGWIGGADSRRLDGWLDEIAVYNRVLTEEEIKLHYYLSKGYCDAWDDAVRIMPMGDSITKDRLGGVNRPEAEKIGYRKQLYNNLYNSDYWFDFIGSESNGDPQEFDTNHTGWGGMRTSHMLDMLPDGIFQSPDDNATIDLNTSGPYLDAYPTDLILMHIGTNDVSYQKNHPQPDYPNGVIANLTAILNHIDTADERTTVLLARIINRAPGGNDADTITLNNAIDDLADSRNLEGDKIILVDMEHDTGLDYQIDANEPYIHDFIDNLHPNPVGYPKLGDQWYQTLDTLMPQFVAPAVASTPVVQVNRDELYQYQVVATGTGTITFAIDTPPSGMTIDSQGLIQWTPAASGSFPVTVTVTNPMSFGQVGSAEHTFTIEVNAPPVITGQAALSTTSGTAITVQLSDLVVQDPDNSYPDDFTLTVIDGPNYTTSSNSVFSSSGFTGMLEVPVTVNDGAADSTVFNLQIEVTSTGGNNGGGVGGNVGDGGGGGGGGCFIETAGRSEASPIGSAPVAPAILAVLFILAFKHQQGFGLQNPKNHMK